MLVQTTTSDYLSFTAVGVSYEWLDSFHIAMRVCDCNGAVHTIQLRYDIYHTEAVDVQADAEGVFWIATTALRHNKRCLTLDQPFVAVFIEQYPL